MDIDPEKLLKLVTDPQVSIPFWGGVGGFITALFRRRHTFMKASMSVLLAAIFANWFTLPILQYFNLPLAAAGGVGGVLGITSYELARVLATSNIYTLISLLIRRKQ